MVEVWDFFHGQPTLFQNNKARLWLCQMVYAKVILQGDVDWTTIPNTRVVKSFPRVKHIPHGLPLEH
jgi:hypothetical protein